VYGRTALCCTATGRIYHILRLHGVVCAVVLWVATCALHKSTGRDILPSQYPLGNGFLVDFISTCLNGFFCLFPFFAMELDMARSETLLCPLETVWRESNLVRVGSFVWAQFLQIVWFQINFGRNGRKVCCIVNTLELEVCLNNTQKLGSYLKECSTFRNQKYKQPNIF